MNIDILQQLFRSYLDAYADIAADERERLLNDRREHSRRSPQGVAPFRNRLIALTTRIGDIRIDHGLRIDGQRGDLTRA